MGGMRRAPGIMWKFDFVLLSRRRRKMRSILSDDFSLSVQLFSEWKMFILARMTRYRENVCPYDNLFLVYEQSKTCLTSQIRLHIVSSHNGFVFRPSSAVGLDFTRWTSWRCCCCSFLSSRFSHEFCDDDGKNHILIVLLNLDRPIKTNNESYRRVWRLERRRNLIKISIWRQSSLSEWGKSGRWVCA